MLLMFQDRLYGLWGNAHITVLPRAPTKLLEFLPRVRQPAIISSNSARDQASLVSTTSIQRANSFVFSAVTGTTACSENPLSELLTMWGRYPHRYLPPIGLMINSSWLQIHRPGLNSRHYQIFWEVVGLERGPLSLMSTTEELLGRKRSGSGLENTEYGFRDPLQQPLSTNVGSNFAGKGSHSVSIVHSRSKATEFSLVL
jgi:hypothetical protein